MLGPCSASLAFDPTQDGKAETKEGKTDGKGEGKDGKGLRPHVLKFVKQEVVSALRVEGGPVEHELSLRM